MLVLVYYITSLEDQDLSAYHKTNAFQKIYYVNTDEKLEEYDDDVCCVYG
jgi:hypothetical protein